MAQKISDIQKADILKLLLLGLSYDDISERTGVSKGSIVNFVEELRGNIGKKDLDTMLDLAKSLKKLQMSPAQMLFGARIYNILENLKIDDENLSSFLTNVYSECIKKNLDATLLVELVQRLFIIQESSDITLEQIPENLQKLFEQRKELQEEIKNLQNDAIEAKNDSKNAIEDKNLTLEILNEYENVKESLAKFDVPIDDLARLSKVLEEASELGFDASKLVEYASLEGKFEERNLSLEKENQHLSEQREEKKREFEKTSQLLEAKKLELSSFESDLEKYGNLKNLNVHLTSKADELKNEITKYRSKLNALSKKLIQTESSITEHKEFSLRVLDDSKNKMIKTIDDAKSLSQENIIDIRLKGTEEITALTKIGVQELTAVISTIKKEIPEILSTFEEVGKLQAIKPLCNVVNSKGTNAEVCAATITFLIGLRRWLAIKPVKDFLINSYIEHIMKFMEKMLVENKAKS